jgi:threonine aldolase
VYNAAVKQNVDVREITRHFDSVSVCLSKGLGAPVGSVLSGSKDFIKKARRIRKMLGGGMRQAGILAGAGLYALHNNINRLAEDHENALSLAQGLSEIKELDLDLSLVQSNMVFVDIRDLDPVSMTKLLREKGIVVLPSQRMRLVTHLDVSARDIKTAIDGFKFAVKNGLRKTESTTSTQLSGPRY